MKTELKAIYYSLTPTARKNLNSEQLARILRVWVEDLSYKKAKIYIEQFKREENLK